MCLVPSCTQVGDVVAMFFWISYTFHHNLEPNSESSEGGLKRVRAQLVGDTYMHGAMYAESFPEAMRLRRLPFEIVLVSVTYTYQEQRLSADLILTLHYTQRST